MVLNLNESLVPSIKHLSACPTPCPCDVRSIAEPPLEFDSSIVLASTYLIKYLVLFVSPPIGVADLLFG